MSNNNRRFEMVDAVRKNVPIILAVSGPSGSGKTYSALRIAEGIRQVMGGVTKVVDTENGRARHYAPAVAGADEPGKFHFKHIPFDEPYSPADYAQALSFAAEVPGPVIIDSMTHEHEGPGGCLDIVDAEVVKQQKRDQKPDTFRAWGVAKKERKKLVGLMLRLGQPIIMCFRAKEKLKPMKNSKGRTVIADMGWLPIGGSEYAFECLIHAMLHPGCDGVPTWIPTGPGEETLVKLPFDFRELFAKPRVLDEEVGRIIGTWAKGATPKTTQRSRQNAAQKPADGPPRINHNVKWNGQEKYSNALLADVPSEALAGYRAAVHALYNRAKDGSAKQVRIGASLDAIDAAIKARKVQPADDGGDIEVGPPLKPVTEVMALIAGITAEDAESALAEHGDELLPRLRDGWELEPGTLALVPPAGWDG